MTALCPTLARKAHAASVTLASTTKADNDQATRLLDRWQALPLAERDRLAAAELRKLASTTQYGTLTYFCLVHAECSIGKGA